MKNIYKTLVVALLLSTVFVNIGYAQYKLYPPSEQPTLTPLLDNPYFIPIDDPDPFPDPKPKPAPTEFERCFCVRTSDIPLFRNKVNDYSNDPVIRDGFLRVQRQVLIDQINNRYQWGARNIREAMDVYFFRKAQVQTESGILQAGSKIRGFKRDFDTKTSEIRLLDIRKAELEQGLTESSFGNLQINGKFISSYKSVSEINTDRTKIINTRRGIQQKFNPEICVNTVGGKYCIRKNIEGAWDVAKKDQFGRNGLINDFKGINAGNIYNLGGLDQIGALNKHLIQDFNSIGNEANTHPSIPSFNLGDQTLGFLLGKAPNGNYSTPEKTLDEMLKDAYFQGFEGSNVQRYFRNSTHVKNEIFSVAKGYGFYPPQTSLIKTLVDAHTSGKSFTIPTYRRGDLFSASPIATQSSSNPNLALEMSLGDKIANRAFYGLSNIINTMEPRADVEGSAISQLLRANGINVPSGLSNYELGSLLYLQYQPASALDRVSIAFRNGYGVKGLDVGLSLDDLMSDWFNKDLKSLGHNTAARIDALYDRIDSYRDPFITTEVIEARNAMKVALDIAKAENPMDRTVWENAIRENYPPLVNFYIKSVDNAMNEAAVIMLEEYPQNHKFTTIEILDIAFRATKETIHLGLDVAGMTPGIGVVFDVTNGILYTLDGDKFNAGISFFSSAPLVGQWAAGSRIASKVVKLNNNRRVYLKIYSMTGGIVRFSGRAQLRKILGITDDAIHAHHLIPYAFWRNDLIQQAAQSINAWHINDIFNGIPMPQNLHQAGHAAYSSKIGEVLAAILEKVGTDPLKSYDELRNFGTYLKNLIKNNPTLTSGQIAEIIRYNP